MTHIPIEDRIILALDVGNRQEALSIVDRFSSTIHIFKVGLELYVSEGPQVVKEIIRRGKGVFLDLKFHDIPNTVARAAIQATRLGVQMFNLHACGGMEMMKRTRDEVVEICLRENLPRPKMVAVTVLTSISNRQFREELGYQHGLRTHVRHLATMAKEAGLDGVVASGEEVKMLRDKLGPGFIIVTPGIRPAWMPPDEQKRRITPKDAVRAGADYLVIGRAVLGQKDPEKALELIRLEVLSA